MKQLRTTLTAVAGLVASIVSTTSAAATRGSEIEVPPISVPIAGCGEVIFDEICEKLFHMEGVGNFSFSGIDAYPVGTTLFVQGGVCMICLLTACGSPYAALLGATVLSCEASGEPQGTIPFDGCVEVLIDPECGPVLASEDGTIYYGEPFITNEQAGLRFQVVGEVSAQFTVLCGGQPVPESLPFFVEMTLSGCLGDLDADGLVGGSDLGLLLATWGDRCGGPEGCAADLDLDGDVDGEDLGLLLGRWG